MKTSTPLLLSVSVISLMRSVPTYGAVEPNVVLEPITVYAKRDIMATTTSEHDVYDKDESSTYKDQEDIERFMGESPADIFKGMIGVQSGDARNSGAIDPNVRGVQGQGRVPVTIDGTEQAITVYRGYKGANNRNYIDPLLISNIKVSKGASMERGVQSSIGGAVTINTLSVEDILKEGDNVALNIKGSIGNNSVAADAIEYSSGSNRYAGDFGYDVYPVAELYDPDKQDSDYAKEQAQKRRDELLNLSGDLPRQVFGGATGKVPDTDNSFFSGEDSALRVTIAGRTDLTDTIKVDGLAAYTYRNRGNYFAGDHGSDNYRTDVPADQRSTGDFAAYMADVYLPKVEVPNTSNTTKSYLLKGTLRANEDQALQLGIRHTETIYGDIMPSRVGGEKSGSLYEQTGRLPQWPLSDVELDSYYLKYRYDPADHEWLDLRANLWQTKSTLNTNNAGGFPFKPIGVFGQNYGGGFEDYKQGMIDRFASKFPEVKDCSENDIRRLDSKTLCGQLSLLYGSNTLVNGDAFLRTYNDRVGFSLDNTAHLTDKLDLTIGGNWQKEELSSDDVQDKLGLGFVSLPRTGRRKAWDVSANFDYQPTDKWRIQAGLTYNNYWSIDDLINERRKEGKSPNRSTRVIGYNLLYYQKANETVQQALKAYNDGQMSRSDYEDLLKQYYPDANTNVRTIYGKDTFWIQDGQPDVAYVQQQYIWQADDQGNFSRENNPFFNGQAEQAGWIRPAKLAEFTNGNTKGSGQAVPILADVTVGDPFKPAKEHKAWAVTPSITTSYQVSDSARTYLRYAQATRMPSLYESTLGFSLQEMDNENQVRPEQGSNFEVGYVQDLTPWFDNAQFADIKLAYYHNRVKDVIDRTDDFSLKNFDHQTIEGIELQSRYDDGNWFGDFSVSHTLKQQVCDAAYAMTQDPYYGQVPDCVKYGFGFGYLQNMGQPDWQADLTLGKRFYDDKLTVGSRLHYHSGADKGVNAQNYGYSNEGTIIFNTPIDWSSAFTVDGFITYKINDDIQVELSGTNLTNQYYLDPLSRTLMPAPGRAFIAKAEVKF